LFFVYCPFLCTKILNFFKFIPFQFWIFLHLNIF
jgi:hypothetical protein